MFVRGGKVLLLVAVGAALGGCLTLRDAVQVDTADTRLHLELSGRRKGEVILFLHGGPGSGFSSLVSFRGSVGPELERRHLLAYLHQRGIMKSPPVPGQTQTIAAHVADVDRTVRYLKQRFPNKRLFLLGHSWGGVLALSYLQGFPRAPVDGLVLVATPVCMPCNERAGYEIALDWAVSGGRARTRQFLERLGPPPYAELDQALMLRRVTRRAIPAVRNSPGIVALPPFVSLREIAPTAARTELEIARAMFGELMLTDLRPALPSMHWPLLAIACEHDSTVIAATMLENLQDYGGPKRLLRFEQSDHQPFAQETERFLIEVSAFVAGLAGPGAVNGAANH